MPETYQKGRSKILKYCQILHIVTHQCALCTPFGQWLLVCKYSGKFSHPKFTCLFTGKILILFPSKGIGNSALDLLLRTGAADLEEFFRRAEKTGGRLHTLRRKSVGKVATIS